ncbi:MAG: glycosyltransferase [Cyanobacteria bacterium P01_A01_bin.83]
MNKPQVTVVVVPRERFSYTRESLESIYQCTKYPFDLVYVDGNSPEHIKNYLVRQAKEKQFKLIRINNYLAPNQARNIGLHSVKTKYVVFVDNDVRVTLGWLEKLVNCAELESASVVCPLVCIGDDILQAKILLAGGEASIFLELKNGQAKRKVRQQHYFANHSVVEVKNQLYRQECEFAKFHCLLVRREVFDAIGLLDEKLLSSREHIDFSLSVTNVGKKIFCEPASVATYVPDSEFEWSDLTYFMLRWSDAWETASLEHFIRKWNLTREDKYFEKRYRRLGKHRHQPFLRPLVRQLSFGGYANWLEKILIAGERKINRAISDRFWGREVLE